MVNLNIESNFWLGILKALDIAMEIQIIYRLRMISRNVSMWLYQYNLGHTNHF